MVIQLIKLRNNYKRKLYNFLIKQIEPIQIVNTLLFVSVLLFFDAIQNEL